MKILWKFIINVLCIITVIILIACIANSNIREKNSELNEEEYINSSEYPEYVANIIGNVINEDVFSLKGYYSSSYGTVNILIYSVDKMGYSKYNEEAQELIKDIYEEIKDKTLKKEDLLSIDDYTFNFNFYESFGKYAGKTNYECVGMYQIHTKKMEKYREYSQCANGAISTIYWEQEN